MMDNPLVSAAHFNRSFSAITRSVSLTGCHGVEKRAFVGTVTKVIGRFGMVDEEVLFHETTVKGCRIPSVGTKVLVEATFNPNAAYKWNTQRVQLLPESSSNVSSDDGDRSQSERWRRSRSRTRSRSPLHWRRRLVPTYSFFIPKVSLEETQLSVMDVKRRYSMLYVPSDFFCAHIRWQESFPTTCPLNIYQSNPMHVIRKGSVRNVYNDDMYPPDADFSYSAKKIEFTAEWIPTLTLYPLEAAFLQYKVMLLNSVKLDEMVQKCCYQDDGLSSFRDKVPLAKVIEFLVGVKENRWNQTAAVGGAWSRALDGPEPGSNPSVLVRTAIRTVRGLIGVDLSGCSRWYRIVDVHYIRVEGQVTKTEVVAIFLPDVWNVFPSDAVWEENVRLLTSELPSSSPSSPASSSAEGTTSKNFPLRLVKDEQLPSTPHILASPSTTVKNGKYDCAIMSLSRLLDYRPETKKEKAFEVGLFAELFNEMLLRDFGFEIYKSLVHFTEFQDETSVRGQPEQVKEEDKRPSNDLSLKPRCCPPASDIADVANPFLLLAFAYFDLNGCGFIAEKDLEDLFLLLGLHLSRSQARKLVQKVAMNGVVNYRPLVSAGAGKLDNSSKLEVLARGNFDLLNTCKETQSTTGLQPLMVEVGGNALNVNNMMALLEQMERILADRENEMAGLRIRLSETEKLASQLQESSDEDRAEIEKLRRELAQAQSLQKEEARRVTEYSEATKAIECILVQLRSRQNPPRTQSCGDNDVRLP